MKKFFYLLLTILIQVISVYSQKEISNPESFIKEVQSKYAELDNIVIDFTQEISSTAVEGKQLLRGKLFYQKQNRYRLEINGQIIVCDGSTVYSFSRKAKRVVITNYEENFYSPQNLLIEIPNYSKIQLLSEEKIKDKKVFKFSLSPSRSNPEFKSMFLWIDQNKNIWKIQTEDWAGNNYTFTVQKFLFNQDLKNELFKFNIPAGVKVVDLR
ncbi:MAG: outer-membrane lipoprotein carrier protein LolA [Ignavibacteria bacterium]|nr:outer-membrane lipoprotein carrier protein LolA [Ignavibacteria bacterium]